MGPRKRKTKDSKLKDCYQLIIPMTGVGQRFVNAGYTKIKPLIQTGMGSMIECVLRNHNHISSPICIISRDHPQKGSLRQEILKNRARARIIEIDGHKNGPSFAIWKIQEELNGNEPCVVNYCDFSGLWSEFELIRQIHKQDGLILTYSGFHPHMRRSQKFAFVKKDSTGKIIDIREKQAFTDNPSAEEASSGTYVFREASTMIEAISNQISTDISVNGEFYTSLTYKPLIEANLEIRTFKIERFFQWGTPEDLNDFQVWSFSKFGKKSKRSLQSVSASNVLVLAAGSGSRLTSSSTTAKPLIKIFGRELWSYAAEIGASAIERLVVTRSILEPEFQESNFYDFKVKGLPRSTKSQCETARIGLEEIKDKKLVVHILACDNLTPLFELADVERLLKSFDMVVWTAEGYLGAIGQEENFSWLETETSGAVTKTYLKEKPRSANAKLIIGNFSFRSALLALQHVELLCQRDCESDAGAKEQHLEALITNMLKAGLRVGAISLKLFAAVGTEFELKIAEYFESAFSGLSSADV
jgi:NDP-sugar pyrophosphorylase family protein